MSAFTFRNAITDYGDIPSQDETENEFFHPTLPTQIFVMSGMAIVLNGWNLNRRYVEATGNDDASTTAVQLLQMRAPRQPVLPSVSTIGNGRVFGVNYIWRYRWYDSRTGEFSGLSPYPGWLVNLGAEQPTGGSGYLGQNASFVFLTAGAPNHADSLQLFRSASSRTDIVYLVESVSITGVTSVTILDNKTDDEIMASELAVSLELPSGPTWAEGIMPPVARAYAHPTGRACYFGLRRFASLSELTDVSVTQGSDVVTIPGGGGAWYPRMDPGRIGQRIRLYSTAPPNPTPIADPTVYRIMQTLGESFRVYPELQESAGLAVGATDTFDWTVEDDRDGRAVYWSQPGQPWLIDPLRTLYIGADFDDDVLCMFSLGGGDKTGRRFVHTRRRIYALLNDFTEDPSFSITVDAVAEEGTVGFDSGCETPFGWVFFNPKRGVMVFDGTSVAPLGFAGNPVEQFTPEDQLANIEPSCHERIVVTYDWQVHAVWVSYVPRGLLAMSESLVYFVADRCWRGPYRERLYASGEMRSTTTDEESRFGDDQGNLYTHIRPSTETYPFLDFVPTTTGWALTGTVTAVVTKRIFTDSSGTYDADGDSRLRGAPIWFQDPATETRYFARIVGVVSSTQLELDARPTDETGAAGTVAVGWTYGVGSIRWTLTTSYIDGGEPILPKTAKFLAVRFKRGTVSETFEAGCAEDASGTYAGQRISSTSAPAPTLDVNGKVRGELCFEREGALFQIRLRGIARNQEPQITTAILAMTVNKGTLG